MPNKLCKDCEYLSGSLQLICIAPYNGLSLIDGEPKPVFASTARSEHLMFQMKEFDEPRCGPEGNFFKHKTIIKKKFWIFW